MLAAHRHSSGGGLPAAQQAAVAAAERHHPLCRWQLGPNDGALRQHRRWALPPTVLENIVGLAAYPLSAWAWPRAGGAGS